MLAKCSVFIATSVDGFIARNDGDIDWLMKANTLVSPDEDCGYKVIISTVTLTPVLIGSGRSLYGPVARISNLNTLKQNALAVLYN